MCFPCQKYHKLYSLCFPRLGKNIPCAVATLMHVVSNVLRLLVHFQNPTCIRNVHMFDSTKVTMVWSSRLQDLCSLNLYVLSTAL